LGDKKTKQKKKERINQRGMHKLKKKKKGKKLIRTPTHLAKFRRGEGKDSTLWGRVHRSRRPTIRALEGEEKKETKKFRNLMDA
jgi:hypothetical protein